MRPVTLSVLLAVSALAQNPAPPAFEVASVKINQQFRQDNRATWLRSIETSPGRLTFRNVNLTMIVAWAYQLQWPQIVGPAGMDSQRYDILAKAGGPASDAEMRLMLRALLAERFKLAEHRETRQMEVLALLVPKSGHKMTESTVEGPTRTRQDPDRGTVVEGALLAEMAEDMSREMAVPIVDMTGLKGRFDFLFNPQKYVAGLRSQVMADPQHALNEAEVRLMVMQETVAGQLGLRLEARRAPVEVLVIDRIEKSPSEN
jgi:uncharacterized protein (TIGR03435 family)